MVRVIDKDAWQERNQQTTKGILAGIGKRRSDFRFCDSCRTYKPKNKAPHVKGWRCTDCTLVKR